MGIERLVRGMGRIALAGATAAYLTLSAACSQWEFFPDSSLQPGEPGRGITILKGTGTPPEEIQRRERYNQTQNKVNGNRNGNVISYHQK